MKNLINQTERRRAECQDLIRKIKSVVNDDKLTTHELNKIKSNLLVCYAKLYKVAYCGWRPINKTATILEMGGNEDGK